MQTGELFTARPKGDPVDSNTFLIWAECLVTDTITLHDDGCKMLVLYDGYRSHLSVTVLDLIAKNDIIVYAFSAHTRSTTQTLDVGVF